MTRRGLLYSLLGLSVAGWAGFKLARRQVEPLAIDPESTQFVYSDGWIVRS